jgi:hypothetical protein
VGVIVAGGVGAGRSTQPLMNSQEKAQSIKRTTRTGVCISSYLSREQNRLLQRRDSSC